MVTNERMHATDLDTGIAYWHSSLRYDARVCGVCALESSSYVMECTSPVAVSSWIKLYYMYEVVIIVLYC